MFRQRAQRFFQYLPLERLVQDERFVRAATRAIQWSATAREQARDHVEAWAKTAGLATKAEVRELKRALRRLEKRLDDQPAPKPKREAKKRP